MPPPQTDVRRTVLNSSNTNWDSLDTPETWVNWQEQIKIKEEPYRVSPDEIDQPDYVTLPDHENDVKTSVRISYQGVPVDHLPALKLDGFRITMIQPNTDPNTGDKYITQYEAKLSQIMSLDDFMQKQGNQIDVDIRGQGI